MTLYLRTNLKYNNIVCVHCLLLILLIILIIFKFQILRENKRNKSIEDFEADCANMLEIVKDCIILHRKFQNHHQEITANLSISKKKLDEYQNKLLEIEQKSKILKKVSNFFFFKCI